MTDFNLDADTQFDSPADAAKYYVEMGLEPIPVPPKQKRPKVKWKEPVQWTGSEIEQGFRTNSNVGVALGDRSNGLCDLDFDSPEAARIGCDVFGDLPSFGRASSHHSHRVFRATLRKGIYRFQIPNEASHLFDVDRLMVMEIRGKGHQTMFPPSVHPTGEKVRWHDNPETIPEADAEDIVRRAGLTSFLAIVANKYPKVAGSRDEVCLALTGVLVRTGASDAEIDRWITLVAQVAGDEEAEKRGCKAAATREKFVAGEQVWGLPALCEQLGIGELETTLRSWLFQSEGNEREDDAGIVVRPGEMPHAVDSIEQALIKASTNIFQRYQTLVRVVRLRVGVDEAGVGRDSGALILKNIEAAWLREQFALEARWFSPAKDGVKRIDPPHDAVTAYLARMGEWKLRFLQGITQSPTLRKDCTVLQDPGYDPSSGLIYDPGSTKFAKIPDSPSLEEAKAALEILAQPFRAFAFANEASRSVALAAVLTALVRSVFPSAPLFAIGAPAAGSGKSLLAETIGIITTGHKPAMMSQGKNAEEDEKRLSSVLMAGDQVVIIDNCEHPIQGDFLCSMLTQEFVRPRILGKSEMRQLPTRCLVIATGNRLQFSGDITRRTLHCYLDAKVERPDQLQFDFDPRAEALRDRPQLVVAGITILRAYIKAGRPMPLNKIGSFEEWNLIRESLVWLGLEDPATTRESILTEDLQKEVLVDLLLLWQKALGTRKLTLKELETIAHKEREKLVSDLLTELASNTRFPNFNHKSVGRFLAKHIDRIAGGLALQAETDSSGVKRYWVVEVRRQVNPEEPSEDMPF